MSSSEIGACSSNSKRPRPAEWILTGAACSSRRRLSRMSRLSKLSRYSGSPSVGSSFASGIRLAMYRRKNSQSRRFVCQMGQLGEARDEERQEIHADSVLAASSAGSSCGSLK